MSFEDDFLDLMPDTVTVVKRRAEPNHVNEVGKAQYDEPGTERQCRLVRKPVVVRDVDGRELVASVTAYMGGDFGTTPEDKLVLDDGTSPEILEVWSPPDDEGAHHEVIRAGRRG